MPDRNMDTRFNIAETEEHGGILMFYDVELADEFDDFANENCYVFTEVKFEPDCVCIYFGQASCVEKIGELVERFVAYNDSV